MTAWLDHLLLSGERSASYRFHYAAFIWLGVVLLLAPGCSLFRANRYLPPLTAAEVVPDFNQSLPQGIHRPTGVWDDPHLMSFRHHRTSKVDPTANVLVVKPVNTSNRFMYYPKRASISVPPKATTTSLSQAPRPQYGPGNDRLHSVHPQRIARNTEDRTVQWTSPPNGTVEYPMPIEAPAQGHGEQVQWSDGGVTVD